MHISFSCLSIDEERGVINEEDNKARFVKHSMARQNKQLNNKSNQ